MNRVWRVAEVAKVVEAKIEGDPEKIISSVTSIEGAKSGALVFVENQRFFEKALTSQACAIIVSEKLTCSSDTDKVLLWVKHPKLAFAKIVTEFISTNYRYTGIQATAILEKEVVIGEMVSIGHYTVIGQQTKIGKRTFISSHCAIGQNVEIGEDCVIHSNVTIYDGVKLHNRVIVHAGTVLGSDGFGYVLHEGTYHKFPQIGNLVIEDDVEIGSNVSIDRGALDTTIIGKGTKIDNLVQVAHNVSIGRNCILAAQVGVSGSSVIEDSVVLGGQVGIADKVKIEQGAVVGAQAGVPTGKIIRSGLTVWGTPARPIDDFKEIYAHSQTLPALKKKVKDIEEKLKKLLF